jgi:vitamin K-dependent gamma-carboxylase
MFPYVCLVTLPLFCDPSWPRKILSAAQNEKKVQVDTTQTANSCLMPILQNDELKITWKHYLVMACLASHVTIQAVLPYSHSLTKVFNNFICTLHNLINSKYMTLLQGYNNWTHGLYGYSWDMMVHNWNTILILPRVVDNVSGREMYLEAEVRTKC